MHRCLLIDEIMTPIFEYLADDKAELAALARTCRAFSDNALDILWHDIRGRTSFKNLIKSTVPRHSWREIPVPFYSAHESRDRHMIIFDRPPRALDWNRLVRYTSRIRLIEIFRDTDGGPRIADGFGMSVFQYLSVYGPPSPILPRLHRLVWHDTYPSLAIPYIRLFLGERMRHISLDIAGPWSSPSKLVTTMIQIQRKCPLLKNIDITDHDMRHSDGVVYPVIRILGFFNHLRSLLLTCKTLDCQAIFDLAKLPALENLDLRLGSGSAFTIPSLGSPFLSLSVFSIRVSDPKLLLAWLCLVRLSPLRKLNIEWNVLLTPAQTKLFQIPKLLHSAFQKLQILRISGAPHLMLCTELIKYIHLSNLHTLIILYRAPARNDLESFLDIISKRCSSLTTIVIRSTGPRDEHRIYDRGLRPLLALSKLEKVVIRSKCDFNLGNSLVEDMAKAWRGLTHIQIGAENYLDNTSRITFEGLIPLARYCRKLEHVELPVNAYSLPLWEYSIHHASQGPSVKHLCFGCCPISRGDISIFAAFIQRLFPNLRHFEAQHPPNGRCTAEDEPNGVCPWVLVEDILIGRVRLPEMHLTHMMDMMDICID